MALPRGYYLDGRRAGRFAARLSVREGMLAIGLEDAGEEVLWPLEEIRALRDNGSRDRLILRLPGGDARLVAEEAEAIRWALAACPKLGAHVRDPAGTRRMLLWAGGAAAALALIMAVAIPLLANRMAHWIPAEAEAQLGRAIRDQAAGLFSDAPAGARWCAGRSGLAALRKMAARLTEGADLPHELRLSVMNADAVNAFAAPGGEVVVMSGLIDAADSAEEVAAVLAHEIGHVAHRDPTRLALRSAGSAAVLGLVVGDVVGAAAVAAASRALLDAHYARGAETAADAFAAERLAAAGVSPAALATFFERLAAESPGSPGVLGLFASHPALESRSRAARGAAERAADRPVLSPREWQALQAVCRRTSATP
ncbi:M48 family metallopeptidase [Mangrovicoccus sp. HB161399]|uniref:M48 family metallopeptidase n=1 Tax=Mangrovicoccus sp. HB161399 TaxID=2720392 RepID=UPI001556C621|nr:M48 family metallopeptidase [Mangrovicoccus sp. HB161399]